MLNHILQLTTFFTIFASMATAQIRLGILGGVGYVNPAANTNYSSSDSYETTAGFSLGAVCNLPLSDWISLQTEPRYSEEGWHNYFPSSMVNASAKISYLDVPVLIKAQFGKSNFRPFLVLGPQLDLTLSAKMEVTEFPGTAAIPIDMKPYYHDLAYGVTGGGGLEFYITPSFSVSPSVQYTYGLSNLRSDDNVVAYARGVQFYVVVLLALN